MAEDRAKMSPIGGFLKKITIYAAGLALKSFMIHVKDPRDALKKQSNWYRRGKLQKHNNVGTMNVAYGLLLLE